MDARRTTNRKMFWRILRRLLVANPGRLFVILLALGSGAAITAALLNLQIDANRRITTEFRAFGANAIITPRDSASTNSGPSPRTFNASHFDRIPKKNGVDLVAKASLLYGIATVAPWDVRTQTPEASHAMSVVAVGYEFFGHDFAEIFPSTTSSPNPLRLTIMEVFGRPPSSCTLGEQLSNRLGVLLQQFVELQANGTNIICHINAIRRFGGSEDSQIFLGLAPAQELFRQKDQASVIALNVPGSPASVQSYLSALQTSLPDLDVRPIRQFTEAQAKIYSRISGLLNFTVALVLILTGLCVMAAMTNVAMERRTDVGLMKAIGGSVRRVLRFFLAEAALLGLAGGVLGGAVGIALSIGLGKAVFGVAARPRLIVYPVAVALTILVAIVSSYPLRRLASIRPAAVFRGEA
jgi:putative ABC transport system permease protein